MAAALAAQQSGVTTGEALFFGKAGCATCHEVNGRGGIVGPDLSGIGTRPADSLREKILNPGSSAASADDSARGFSIRRWRLAFSTRIPDRSTAAGVGAA